MSFPRYPEYKDSGVEWLGEVPAHWELRSLKSILAERNEKNDPIKTREILSLTMDRGVIPYSERSGGGNRAKEDLTAYKLAYPQDIVVNSMNVIAGSVGLSSYFGAVSPVYYMLHPRHEADEVRYFSQIFQAETFQKSLYGLGNGIMVKESESSGKLNTIRMRIPMGKLNSVVLPYPEPAEQTAIAAFLDRETAKIDALVAEQRRLIELLKEKRQAVISHSVTKGLNPDAPMKDSGIEWLGEVPAHWIVQRVKFAAKMDSGHTPSRSVPEYWEDCNIPWVSLNDTKTLKANDYIRETAIEISELGMANSSAHLIPAGSVVFTRDATIGLTAILERPMAVSQHIITWTPNPIKLTSEFLLLVFRAMEQYLDSFTMGSTIKTIGMPEVRKLTFALPPLAEQGEISAFVRDEVSKLDTLTAEAQRAIDLLQERRTALISAAVTGQIDVRKLAGTSV